MIAFPWLQGRVELLQRRDGIAHMFDDTASDEEVGHPVGDRGHVLDRFVDRDGTRFSDSLQTNEPSAASSNVNLSM